MSSSSSSSAKTKRSARRCLFGRADPALTQQWLTERLEEIRNKEKAKWGFNFSCEMPIPGTSEYEFTPIGEDSVPEFYRTKHIPSISSTVSSPTKENQVELCTSDDSDSSMMDISMSPITPAKREHATPKKRHGKVTDYMVVRKKRLQHSPKRLDIVLPENGRGLASRV
ncbi:Cyclin-dependent kinase inhibitor [Teladorsagia circumcincta]|uniref:Cyclin-dependent kinase inhibitor n=1 Tax=Teladorsagia circumcincta TaxID=45464 RepID=A0A2G9V0F3_TELCI|nr:Cyclin-dependent kinase inhibitor [Teladorsagia circumcincta]